MCNALLRPTSNHRTGSYPVARLSITILCETYEKQHRTCNETVYGIHVSSLQRTEEVGMATIVKFEKFRDQQYFPAYIYTFTCVHWSGLHTYMYIYSSILGFALVLAFTSVCPWTYGPWAQPLNSQSTILRFAFVCTVTINLGFALAFNPPL